MNEIIVSDTSCLIVLSKTGRLELLKLLFSEVLITPEVAYEFGEPLPAWILVQSSNDSHLKSVLTTQLDLGEASAIGLKWISLPRQASGFQKRCMRKSWKNTNHLLGNQSATQPLSSASGLKQP